MGPHLSALDHLFESSNCCMQELASDGRILRANRALLHLLGYTEAEFNGASFPSYCADTKALRDALVVLQARQPVKDLPLELTAFDGTTRSFVANATPMALHEDLLTSIWILQDISDLKKLEARLSASEERYRAIVGSQAEMHCQFRPDGTILFANDAYAHAMGVSVDVLVGGNFWDFVAVEDRPKVRAMLDSLTPESPEVQIENRFGSFGSERSTLWTNRGVLFDEAGRLLEARSTGFDITDRKQAEEKVQALLRISEKLNSTLDVDTLLDLLVQEAIKLVRAESGCAGLSTDGGMHCRRYFKKGREVPLDYCWPPMHGLPGWVLVHRVPYRTNDASKDQQIVPELCTEFGVRSALSVPMITARGEVVGFFELHNKNGDRGFERSDEELLLAVARIAAIAVQNALAYRALQTAEESLKEADKRKDEFIATLAHELRNPLAPIRTGLEILKLSGRNSAVAEGALATMERQMRQMTRLIDDLLELSRITSGKMELRKRSVDLEEVMRNALEASRPLIDGAQHNLEVRFPREKVVLSADPHRLAQILSNLLNNAAKYTPDGGLIEFSGARVGERVVLSVRDSGMGIPVDKQEQIFEMFTQIERPIERSSAGLGIGLTLVRSLVTLHNGEVEVLSDGPNRGAEFRVTLPVADATIVELETTELESVPTGEGLKLLIVDDNRDAADALSMMLELLGNEVRTAYDGEEALAAAEEFEPDAVLLDLGMPKIDGYEVARGMRAQPWSARCCLIALTGWGQEEDKRRTREAGFDFHLVKPVEPADVQRILADHVDVDRDDVSADPEETGERVPR